jgi:large subunit ribosomal protein L21
MKATIKAQGQQFTVQPNDILVVNQMTGQEPGSVVSFNEVLAVGDGVGLRVGTPYVDGVSVKAKVLEHKLADKVMVIKFKRRKGYLRQRGHRQRVSVIQIESFEGVN